MLKNIIRIIFCFFLMLNIKISSQNQTSPRTKLSLDDHWKFYDGDINNASLKELNDSDWESINIPHTWNLKDAYSDSENYRRGIGWYRKELNVDSSYEGKKLFLYFEGANQTAEVFVNGNSVGKHTGGYTAFCFNITNQIKISKSNLISVKVDNSFNNDIPPLDADFTFYGGIYRDVWLIAVNDVHLDLLDNASPGIFISTSKVNNESALLNIKGKVVNESGDSKNLKVINKIIDAQNKNVKSIEKELSISANSSNEFDISSEIKSPKLWSPDNPYLYKIVTQIYDGDKLVDEEINPLGFRWFKFDADKGFFLNGKHLKLVGSNKHQDYPSYGNAIPNIICQKDLKIIKENGFNFVRLAHYPQDPTVLQTADELGLIVWQEIPVVNRITLSKEFSENCKNMLVEMIRQNYNHPSIIMWGYMNEIRLRPPQNLPENYFKKITELEETLNTTAKSEDESRVTVTAYFSGELEHANGYENIPDVVGMNLYFGWYYDNFKTFGKFVDVFHQKHPHTPLIISEYGGGSDERVHSTKPVAFDFSTEYQQQLHEETFPQIMNRDFISGSALWNQFDFGSKFRDDTKPNLNQKGIYYFDRTPKDVSFYYKAELKKEPILYIATRDYQHRAGSDNKDRNQSIKIYTNLSQVEVFLNHNSLGKFNPQNFTINFSATLHDGKNLITAKAYKDENEIIDNVNINYDERTLLFESKNSNGRTIAVNCGSDFNYIDESGLVWEADKKYGKGLWGYIGGEKVSTHHRIFNSKDEPIYQTAIDNVSSYKFDVPDGLYEVNLRFCEIQNKKNRIFGIKINDKVISGIFKLNKQYGIYQPAEITEQILVTYEKGIRINFESMSENTLINGISIRKIY